MIVKDQADGKVVKVPIAQRFGRYANPLATTMYTYPSEEELREQVGEAYDIRAHLLFRCPLAGLRRH